MAERRDIACHECGRLIGFFHGDPHAGPGVAARVVHPEPGVSVFVDFARSMAELHCPDCGKVGRYLRFDKFRGVVLEPGGEGMLSA